MRLLLTSSNKLLKFLQQRGNYAVKSASATEGELSVHDESVLEAIYAAAASGNLPIEDVALRTCARLSGPVSGPLPASTTSHGVLSWSRMRETRKKLSETTHYSHIVLAARALIAVYLDTEAMYDEVKDHQAAGACIENMLLAAEALGLGCGLARADPEKQGRRSIQILDLASQYDLMAVLAIGHPLHRSRNRPARGLTSLF